jgi:hypothetical protein
MNEKPKFGTLSPGHASQHTFFLALYSGMTFFLFSEDFLYKNSSDIHLSCSKSNNIIIFEC